MAGETDITTGASGNASQTEMETITLNNRIITVPKEAAAILKDTESNLMRGYQEKLSNEREEMNRKLNEDTNWYNTHDQSLWGNYDPVVGGGKGFKGDESQLTVKKEIPTANSKSNALFRDDIRVKQLERELEETKKAIKELQISDIKRGAEQVKKDRDDLLRKYPYADYDSVTEGLRNFWTDNLRHPSTQEIETIVKKKNDFVAVKVANAKQEMIPKKTAAPSVRGTSPLPKKDKLPALEDIDGWIKLAHEDMAGG